MPHMPMLSKATAVGLYAVTLVLPVADRMRHRFGLRGVRLLSGAAPSSDSSLAGHNSIVVAGLDSGSQVHLSLFHRYR